ncbi:MAG TPA: hypothetical protein PK367_00860 [Candidatus Paceibacterota bacterium]|nr:hypothetical protein [Candidatus Paceibacterota bacterium]
MKNLNQLVVGERVIVSIVGLEEDHEAEITEVDENESATVFVTDDLRFRVLKPGDFVMLGLSELPNKVH